MYSKEWSLSKINSNFIFVNITRIKEFLDENNVSRYWGEQYYNLRELQENQNQNRTRNKKVTCEPRDLKGRLEIDFAPPPGFEQIAAANPALHQATDCNSGRFSRFNTL